MKKLSLFLILSLTLCFFSCDNIDSVADNSADTSVTENTGSTAGTGGTGETPDAETLTDQEKAAYALVAINDALQNISWSDLDALVSSKASKASIYDPISIPLGTLYNADGMTIEADLFLGLADGIGIGLAVGLDNYVMPTLDGTEVLVCGEVDIALAYQSSYIINQYIALYADTPMDNQLVFAGGLMDGQKVGLNNVALKFNISELNLGSPVVFKGTVLINDVPLYVDSEIFELLMNFI